MFSLNKYKSATLGLLAIGLVMSIGWAAAGQRLVYQVNINDTYRFAVGTMADARGSSDSQQWIGCSTNAYLGASSTSNGAFCYAANSAGAQRSCTTYDANLVQAVRSLGPESYLYFTWKNDGSGQCEYIFVEHSSRWKPASVSGN